MLVVDDDDSVREYLRILLEQAGYSVIAVDNGRTALAYLANVRADLIVLDLNMPVLDGWTFAKAVRADGGQGRIPIVVFSAVDAGDIPGVAATLTKPSTPETLLATIERVLRDRRRTPRYAARFQLRADAAGQPIYTTTCDVSSGGIAFDSAFPPRIGERILLTVELPVHGATTLEVEVRDVAPFGGGFRVGAQLVAFQSNATGFEAELLLLARARASSAQ